MSQRSIRSLSRTRSARHSGSMEQSPGRRSNDDNEGRPASPSPEDSANGVEDDYDIPRVFSNLNEAEGPSPSENPDELVFAPHHSLEEYRRADAAERRASQRPPSSSDDGRSSKHRRETVSRLRTEIYTISYLVFCSLLGTLARLGLVSLTTYAGAPVSFGILWANFSGTAVLGFLAELSSIINRDFDAMARREMAEKEKKERRLGQLGGEQEKDNVPPRGSDDACGARADSNSTSNSTVAVAEAEASDPVAHPAAQPVEDHETNADGGVNGAALDEAESLAPVDDSPTLDPIVRRRPIPLYVGLATGFCGSFTSFSSFLMDVFDALANTLPAPPYHPGDLAFSASNVISRPRGENVMALLAVLFLTVCMCLSALKGGAHIAIAVRKVGKHFHTQTPWLARHRGRRIPLVLHVVDHAVVVLALVAWLAAVLLTVFQPGAARTGHWRGEVLFALVFAPLGCLLRFYMSLQLNGIFATFPAGTFAVNMLGTAVLGMAWDLQHASAGSASVVSCQLLQGIMDGFCGCLTTVSTWMTELSGLRRRHAYVYGLVSTATGLALLVLIMGSLKWTVGWQTPVCG
ncbi:hypothetical protein SEPCBS119000_003764 [Sporothrix epigloea]|uniref:Chromosome condensation protein n=1 Tax=Sporothrix epigloea TaxID=1892477 RepID=A0ABP0DS35_9PEZI